jgi:hypothetical protein
MDCETLNCRKARALIAARDITRAERAALELHLESCRRCARERLITSLSRAVLESFDRPAPSQEFFARLRAAIALQKAHRPQDGSADQWTALVWVTARQLIPALAALLLLIFVVSWLWSNQPEGRPQMAVRPSERVIFGPEYDYPQPTHDDVLETLVAVEERGNGN